MAIPDQIPKIYKEPTEQERVEHIRALKRVRHELYLATKRLNVFLENTPAEKVIRHVHTAKTIVTNEQGDDDTIHYFSLWTGDDMRLTDSGLLLRSDDYPEKFQDMRNGADKSYVITDNDLRQFTTAQLGDVATHLEKFLKPKAN